MKYIPLLALLVCAACGSTEAKNEAEGTWTANQLGGAALPGIMSFGQDSTIRLVRDTLHLRADGSFRQATHLSITKGSAAPYGLVVEMTGTFKRATGAKFLGSTEIVTATSADGTVVLHGYLTGDMLEINYSGAQVRYGR